MKEIEKLKKFLLSESSEKGKDHLVFPIFDKLFPKKFKKETDAEGADIYIEGKLIVELKTNIDSFLPGFYQALHYAKKGLSYSAICVLAHKFIAIWKINSIPDVAKKLSNIADAQRAPSEIGIINARKTSKADTKSILKCADFKLLPQDFEGFFEKATDTELYEFVQVIKHLDVERQQINTHNFISKIELLEKFFDTKIEAIHCFYAMVGFWDITSKVVDNNVEDTDVQIMSIRDSRASEQIKIKPRKKEEFKKFVENHYIFTNEGSGLTVDYYFSRFDEVISKIDPEYTKQHGIFFTDNNLSKFALWFVHTYFEKKLSEKYIVLDPAGGSGNLVTSWRGHIKHKIVSELQIDLLKTIERRMRLSPDEIQTGFTIIPKTSKNEGLNFLDKSANMYVNTLMNELAEKNLKLNKPIAFLLNPPYKNTDENENLRNKTESDYNIHPSIIDLTGNDAGKERYLAFLGQIINISKIQMGELISDELNFDEVTIPKLIDSTKVETPLLLIFTPTSWLIPRPTYINFRKIFDTYFNYEMGFIILGNEFFKIAGRFPIAFTIWSYKRNIKGNKNKIIVKDLTSLTKNDLTINWNAKLEHINEKLKTLINSYSSVNFSQKRNDIKNWVSQTMYDFKRDRTKTELSSNKVYGGLPLLDERRNNKKTYGTSNSIYLGFMDDNTPVRIKNDNYSRFSNKPDRVWFRLDSSFADVNKTRLLNGPLAVKGYCAFDLESAKKTFTWFCLTKVFNGKYPIWANQFDLWAPNISDNRAKYFYSLCFAYGLAENRCVVTKFEKDNPIESAPEAFIDNPLCPINPDSFWNSTLNNEIISKPILASELVELIKLLYKKWNIKYCKGQNIYNVGLHNEPYFKFFDYPDFLTPHSGIIQIKKYSELQNLKDLLDIFAKITLKSKEVKDEIYKILIKDFKYFE